jgi:polysaccharide deacetylase/carbohydrate binding protein with CBM4/9 domain
MRSPERTTTPATPSAATRLLYPKPGGGWYEKNSGGIESHVSAPAARLSGRQSVGVWAPSYDDAWGTHATVQAMHAARHQRCTLYITTANLNVAGKMTTAQVAAAYAAGHEIGSHNVDHTAMTSFTAAQRDTQWDSSKSILEGITGVPGSVTSYCYPYGTWDDVTDVEAYGRYDRIADIGLSQSFNKTPWQFQVGDRPFRHGRFPWAPTTHTQFIALLKTLVTQPLVLTSYSHEAGSSDSPTLTQMQEAMDLAVSLGIPVIRSDEAFPGPLVANPRFESGSLDPWTASVPNGVAEILTDTPDAGTGGTKVLHMTNTSTGVSSYVSQAFPLIPGRSYTVSMRYKVANLAGASRFSIRVLQYGHKGGANSTGNISSVLNVAATSTTWAVATYTFTTDVNQVTTVIRPEMNAQTGDVWIDRVWLNETRWGSFA